MLSGSGSTPVEVLAYAKWMRCTPDELCANQNFDGHFIGVMAYVEHMLENLYDTEVGIKSPAHVKAQPYTLAGAGLLGPTSVIYI